MDHKDQINAFHSDLEALIKRYRSEFNLPYPSAIGVLEMAKLDLWDEWGHPEDDEEPTSFS